MTDLAHETLVKALVVAPVTATELAVTLAERLPYGELVRIAAQELLQAALSDRRVVSARVAEATAQRAAERQQWRIENPEAAESFDEMIHRLVAQRTAQMGGTT